MNVTIIERPEIPAELETAIKTMVETYRRAIDTPHVRRPVSFALYETWRKIEEQEGDRKK